MTDSQNPSNADYEVCIVGGAGHVGLPLALVLADQGRPTLIHDVNEGIAQTILGGAMPFKEEGGDELLARVLESGRLGFSADPARVKGVPWLIITIGTPVDEFLNPVYRMMTDCLDRLVPHLSDDQTLILRSTVPPGVTDWLHRYLRENGLKTKVAFCPERVVQGRAIEEIQTLPQIVSGTTPEAEEAAAEFFGSIASEVVRMAPIEAEFAKLFCNAHRYVQFALTNQFFMMVSSVGLDYHRILDGMKQNYSRMSGFPGAGFAAGPCLFKDTLQLCSFYENQFSLGFDAVNVNEGLPLFLVRSLEQSRDLTATTVGLLGMAFKPNSDDTRSSLSYKLRKVLHPRAREVLCTDLHVDTDKSLLPVEEVIERSDVLILCVPHDAYRELDLKGKPIIDIWDFLPRDNRVTLGRASWHTA